MDDRLVPMMALLLLAVLAGAGYATWSMWRTRRAVAWNVVNAALTLRRLAPEQVAALDQAVLALLPGMRMDAAALARAEPEVRYALMAIAMQRQGLAAAQADRPFTPMASPQLARSVRQHLKVVRFHAENAHGVVLGELDDAT